MGSFADSIKANIKEVKQEVNDKILGLATYGFTEVVEMSPSEPIGSEYAIGLLKNQWYLSFNSLSSNLSSSTSQSGANSLLEIQKLTGAKTFLGKDGYVSFTNNVPHGERAEFIGWYPTETNPDWKGTPPYGMVARAMIKMSVKA